jgi:hypothetical protein
VNDKEKNFSFKEVKDRVEELRKEKELKQGKKVKTFHISEKIKQGKEIKENLPEPGFLDVKFEDGIEKKTGEKRIIVTHKDTEGKEVVEVTNGLFNIDLRNDVIFWFIRTPEVVPTMINQAVRTAIDRKKCYEVEKRKIDYPILLIIGLIIGALIIGFMFISAMSGG